MAGARYGVGLAAAIAAGFLGGVVAARLGGPATVAAQTQRVKVIEAEEFRLIEPDGKPAGRLHVDTDGRPGLFLFDKHGEVRAVLGVLPTGSPHLALSDRRGQVRLTLAVFTDQRAGIALTDEDGRRRVDLAVAPDGTRTLEGILSSANP